MCENKDMSAPAPEVLGLATSTCVLAAMIVLGFAKGMLDRVSVRSCPSCGHQIRAGGRCGCTS
jgi:hypothetical protein